MANEFRRFDLSATGGIGKEYLPRYDYRELMKIDFYLDEDGDLLYERDLLLLIGDKFDLHEYWAITLGDEIFIILCEYVMRQLMESKKKLNSTLSNTLIDNIKQELHAKFFWEKEMAEREDGLDE